MAFQNTSESSNIYVFGNNREGQLGIACGDDNSTTPTIVIPLHFEASKVVNISCNQKQSAVITSQGSYLNCGGNDSNELGRSGKRSCFHRVDALEIFDISDAAMGYIYYNSSLLIPFLTST